MIYISFRCSAPFHSKISWEVPSTSTIHHLLFTSHSLFNLLPSRFSLPFYLTTSQDQTLLHFKIKKKHFALPFLSSQKHCFLTTTSLTTCFPSSHFITLCSKDFFFSFTCQHSGLPNSVLSPPFFSHYSTP